MVVIEVASESFRLTHSSIMPATENKYYETTIVFDLLATGESTDCIWLHNFLRGPFLRCWRNVTCIVLRAALTRQHPALITVTNFYGQSQIRYCYQQNKMWLSLLANSHVYQIRHLQTSSESNMSLWVHDRGVNLGPMTSVRPC